MFFSELVDELIRNKLIRFEEFKALMETCKFFADLPNAKALFKHVYRRGTNLDTRAINSLLSIYKDISQLPPLDDTFYFLERMGVRPDQYTFGLLFSCVYRSEQPIAIVDRIVEEMETW